MARARTPDAACTSMREAISAQHDGEALPAAVTPAALADHLERCAGCRGFASSLPGLRAKTEVAAATPVPPLTSAILTHVAEQRGASARPTTRQLRWLVGLAGVAQLVLALPMLIGLAGPDLHAGRDLGALQLALGVGLLFAALQPRRAVGVLPVAAVVAATTVVVAAIDVATGAATLTAELTHISELVGVVALWALARRTPTLVAPSAAPPAPAATTGTA
jgi:predicted anti-sigma-YlaC factor YlaD